jgi:ribosomal protein S4
MLFIQKVKNLLKKNNEKLMKLFFRWKHNLFAVPKQTILLDKTNLLVRFNEKFHQYIKRNIVGNKNAFLSLKIKKKINYDFKRRLYCYTKTCSNTIVSYDNDNFGALKHQINAEALIWFWNASKLTKRRYKFLKFYECRQLKKLASFFRNFGFRKNKNRPEQVLQKTKKFKKFALYRKILRLFLHKKKLNENWIYPIQAFRTNLSYYKMRCQTLNYFLKNYFSSKLNKHNITYLAQTIQKQQKNQLINFISKIEFTLSTLLLRMRLLSTVGIVAQFIKHGSVYVNYKKIISPLYNVKPGDTVTIFINPGTQFYHRFNDPLHANRLTTGLYRKNSGRQSPIAMETFSSFIKSGLNTIYKLNHIKYTRPVAYIWKRIRIRGKFWWKKLPKSPIFELKNYFNKEEFQSNMNSAKISSWKHSFVMDTINSLFLKNIPHLDKIKNSQI